MRESRFTDEQIVAVLQAAERRGKTDEVCGRRGLSRDTFYRWRKQFGGMQAGDAKRLRTPEEENRRLKRIVADRALNIAALKDVPGEEW
jgi:putative transposase